MGGKKKHDVSASIGDTKQQVILKNQGIKSSTPLPSNQSEKEGKGKGSQEDPSPSNNKPRNLIILDATKPYSFEYTKFGVAVCVTVQQTADDETWPGGALWDCAVILAKLLVFWTNGATVVSPRTSVVSPTKNKVKTTAATMTTTTRKETSSSPSASLVENGCLATRPSWKDSIILELGCGVGLTGLVAASLGARIVILTDLQVVIDNVTQRNVEMNTIAPSQFHSSTSSKACGYRMTRSGSKVVAMPLYWGHGSDEDEVIVKIKEVHQSNQSKHKHALDDGIIIYPDWIFIGDVAYQQYPGAPSHFDALLSTVKRFVGPNTRVLLGTRNRMPASQDLLHLFQTHLREVSSVDAHEVDARLLSVGRKHNMTIHIFCNKEMYEK